MGEAEKLGPSEQRSQAYRRAERAMADAAKGFQRLFEQTGDPAMQARMEEANTEKFWAHKLQTL